MKNKEIAKILYGIADYLEAEKETFKPFAYKKAAVMLEAMEEDIEEIYKKGGIKALVDMPVIGESIAAKIEEYLKTGKIKYYEDLKKILPIDLEEIIRVEGLGPRKAKTLYQKLGIKNLKDLEKAAKTGKIAPLFGFGEKAEKNILEGLKFLKRSKGRFLLGEILPRARDVYEKLRALKEVEEISLAGSVRRMKETIGDIDFLVILKDAETRGTKTQNYAERVMDYFVSLPGVIKVWGKGGTKASVRMAEGFDMDIRVLQSRSYGAALQYFTGSKEHNIILREIAMDKGLKLSEYGLFKKIKNQKSKIKIANQNSKISKRDWIQIGGRTEEEIYQKLGLDWIPPELRENQGEIEAALKRKLPKLIDEQDIKGDLHIHSDWNGGDNSIEELAEAAQNMGYEYLGISDHTKFLRIEHGLDEKQLAQQGKEIEKLNAKFQNPNAKSMSKSDHSPFPMGWVAQPLLKGCGEFQNKKFRILQGCEANIMPDGSIDIKDGALAKLDFVIAGIHSSFKLPKEKMTDRIIKAMKNPNVDIISHPTGRLIQKREAYQIDFEKILRVAKETGTILEINSHPKRLDLSDQNIRRAKEAGVKMVINTDSHQKDQLRFINFGISQARRGWAEKCDIINTQPLEKLLEYFRA